MRAFDRLDRPLGDPREAVLGSGRMPSARSEPGEDHRYPAANCLAGYELAVRAREQDWHRAGRLVMRHVSPVQVDVPLCERRRHDGVNESARADRESHPTRARKARVELLDQHSGALRRLKSGNDSS